MPSTAGLAQVPTSAIRALVGEGLAQFEVYLSRPSDNSPVLYRKAGSSISLPDFDQMAENGVHHLYVGAKDFHACEQALESQLGKILADPAVAPAQKAEIVHTAGQSIARHFIQESVTSEGLIRTTNIVDTMIDSVLTETAIASHLLDMASHERSTASHMFIVSTLAVLLGAEVFGADQKMLRTLGIAGMLHDLGKLSIPGELLNKTTPLTREEAKLVQQHPIESVRLIGDDPHVTPETRQMILQHHERVDGRGYPLGLPDSHLLPGSKVLSIVDSFHAMIGRRSYRLPIEPDEANRIMKTQAGKQFDAELLPFWDTVCLRCSSETIDPVSTRPTTPGADEVASRHEHRPTPSAPNAVDRRPARFECRGNATVACVHAGRLVTGASSPPEFGALVHDISRGGLCIYTAHPMYRGEILNVRMFVNNNPVWMRAAVAWCRQKDASVYKIGLRFMERLSKDQKDALVDVQPLRRFEPTSAGAEQDKGPANGVKPSPAPKDGGGDKADHALHTLDAIKSLRKVGRDAQQTAVTLAMSGDIPVRIKAVDVLKSMNTRLSRDALVTLLNDVNVDVRGLTISAVAELRVREAIGPLRALLRDPAIPVALSAAGALGKLADQSGLRFATEILEQDIPEARRAARIIGEIIGQRFSANREGVKAARRYLEAKKLLRS